MVLAVRVSFLVNHDGGLIALPPNARNLRHASVAVVALDILVVSPKPLDGLLVAASIAPSLLALVADEILHAHVWLAVVRAMLDAPSHSLAIALVGVGC